MTYYNRFESSKCLEHEMLKNVGVTYADKGSELSRLQGGVHGTATCTGAAGGGLELFVSGQVSGFTAGQLA